LFFILFYDISKALKKQSADFFMKKIVVTSGYFNPLHIGHINLIKEAKTLGDFLVVVVNNDVQVKIKGSVPFTQEQERFEMVKAIKFADHVMLSVDKDATVAESLKEITKQHQGEFIFAKGGDRNFDNLPESEKQVCQEFNIKVVNNVGGGKVQSSSTLLKNVVKP
jgi:cytidyltransferase-like protein